MSPQQQLWVWFTHKHSAQCSFYKGLLFYDGSPYQYWGTFFFRKRHTLAVLLYAVLLWFICVILCQCTSNEPAVLSDGNASVACKNTSYFNYFLRLILYVLCRQPKNQKRTIKIFLGLNIIKHYIWVFDNLKVCIRRLCLGSHDLYNKRDLTDMAEPQYAFPIFDISHCLFNIVNQSCWCVSIQLPLIENFHRQDFPFCWRENACISAHSLSSGHERIPHLTKNNCQCCFAQLNTRASQIKVQSDTVFNCYLCFSYISSSPSHSQSIGSDSVLSPCGQGEIACKTDTQGCRENVSTFWWLQQNCALCRKCVVLLYSVLYILAGV